MFKRIIEEFNNDLDLLQQQDQGHQGKVAQGIFLCNRTLSGLKEVTKAGFQTPEEEIHFFKRIKPQVMGYLIYFTQVRVCELRKPRAGKSNQVRFYEKQMRKVNKFFSRNVDFVHYMEEEYDHLDRELFTRKVGNGFLLNAANQYSSPEFSTSHDMLWAQTLAMYRMIEYLTVCRRDLEAKGFGVPGKKRKGLAWTGSKTSLIELIYALYSGRAINNGSIELSTMTSCFEEFFSIKLDNVYKTYSEIKERKGSKTKFLEELMIDLQRKMNREDE